MPFTLIEGKFQPVLGVPDGDSVRFVPNNANHLKRLGGKKTVKTYRNQGVTSVQLRYEGIDAVEKAASHPHSSAATRANLQAMGGPGTSRQDPTPGYILARVIGPHRRPVSFVFAGRAPERDGTQVHLDESRLRQSLNYRLLRQGHAYPLFYDTLFWDLRNEMIAAVDSAYRAGRGVWGEDSSMDWVEVRRYSDLEDLPPIFPPLWRALEKWGRNRRSQRYNLASFRQAQGTSVELIDRAHDGEFRDVIEVSGSRVRLTEWPENLKFR